MKFVAVIVLAIAISASASVVPLAYSSWAHGPSLTVSEPARLYAAAPTHWAAAPVAAQWAAPALYAAPHAHAYVAAPQVHAYVAAPQAHAYVAAPAPAIIAHAAPEAQYVAANRGSVHVAPLPGHTASVSSVNQEAAPGTW